MGDSKDMEEGWNSLPDDILDKVLSELPTADSWKARKVSMAWARKVRQLAHFEVVIRATWSNLVYKVKELEKQQLQRRVPHAAIAFELATHVDLSLLLSILRVLTEQVSGHSNFRLKIRLNNRMSNRPPAVLVAQAAHFASLLTNQGITINISLQPVPGVPFLPSQAALRSLAPYMNYIEMYHVSLRQYAYFPGIFYFAHSGFTSAHVDALEHCSASLTALCVSEFLSNASQQAPHPMAGNIAGIAKLSSLTKLHLTFSIRTQDLSLEPLGQLTSLKDLALQCYCNPASCADVLHSNQHSLGRLVLSAQGWDAETYSALQQLAALELLYLKLWQLSVDQASLLVEVTAECIQLDLHEVCLLSDQTLTIISSAKPGFQLRWLMLWNVTDASCQALAIMPSLKSLYIINSPQLTATSFNTYAGVSQLVLVNCPGIGLQGVQHILSTAFTSVETLAFQCFGANWGDQRLSNRCLAEVSVLQALALGRNLCRLDLTGLRNLTERGIKKLQVAIQQAQSEGRVQHTVNVVLPARSMSSILRRNGHCQVPGVVMPYVHLPPFWLDPHGRVSRMLVCRPQSTKNRVAKVLRNVIIMVALHTVCKTLSEDE